MNLRKPATVLAFPNDGRPGILPVLTYDLVLRQFVRREEPDRFWPTFRKLDAATQLLNWQTLGGTHRFTSVAVTEENLQILEEWLLELGDNRSAWKLRASYPKCFFFDHDALHRRVAQLLAQFV